MVVISSRFQRVGHSMAGAIPAPGYSVVNEHTATHYATDKYYTEWR